MLLKEVHAHKILDSRGEETIEVTVNGCSASSPSGKSKGKYETPSYWSSLNWNVKFLNKYNPGLSINSFADLAKVEKDLVRRLKLDNIKQFGANALFALESAILKAVAKSQKKELWQIINPRARHFPIPLGNAVGGGMHSLRFPNHPAFQEFLLIPNYHSISKNIRTMDEVYQKLQKILFAKKINDEGAWQTHLSNEEVLEVLSRFKTKVKIGIDSAASSFYKKNLYCYKSMCLNKNLQIRYINLLIKKFNLFYVEDPLQEEDFSGFSQINKRTLVCGDDLTVTHINRLKQAIKEKSINAMIIKPNQNGSLLEVAEIFQLCRKHKIKTVLSHRSGETMDSAIADYAFAFGADFIKTGIATKWRKAKLDRLLEIQKSLR